MKPRTDAIRLNQHYQNQTIHHKNMQTWQRALHSYYLMIKYLSTTIQIQKIRIERVDAHYCNHHILRDRSKRYYSCPFVRCDVIVLISPVYLTMEFLLFASERATIHIKIMQMLAHTCGCWKNMRLWPGNSQGFQSIGIALIDYN